MLPPFRIIDISVPQFATFESAFLRDDPNVTIEIALTHGVNPPEHRFMAGMAITLKQKGAPILKIETRMAFDFRPDDFARFMEGEAFTMPTELVRHFTSILYDTSRGLLMSRLENTPMAGIILQPVDLGEVIDKPLVIRPEKAG